MNVLGIVAEYNPFHNGHLYHLQTSRVHSGADCVVVVMSGNFTQRGEPAVVDKWARTEMALQCGVDLVIELPVPYAMASAEYFAFGAVRLLDSLGIVNTLYFGSESGNLDKLSTAASILADEPAGYKEALKGYLDTGKSYPAARQKALSVYLKEQYGKDSVSSVLSSSNNILGVEYLKAIKRLNSSIVPVTINRIGNAYNSTTLDGSISSATSIRKVLSDNTWQQSRELLTSALPNSSMAILEREFELGRGPVFPSDFADILLAFLRKMSLEQISALPYMEEGLENRIRTAASKAGTYVDLLNFICTKRYTNTRIQRILFSILTGLNQDLFDNFNNAGGPSYIRVLGFNHTGRQLLSEMKTTVSLPVITKTADYKKSQLYGVKNMLNLEAEATDLYVLGNRNPLMRNSGSDYIHNVIYFNQ